MRVFAALLCLCALAGAEDHLFVELELPRDTFYVREPIRMTLRVGIDRDFLKNNVVPMFAQPVDIPVHVRAPWLDAWAGDGGALRVALNDNVVHARRIEPRGEFDVFEIERTFVPTEPGNLLMTPCEVAYAWGTKFREDFIHGRVATDRRDDVVAGPPLTLKILALPDPPPGFTGAVGRFTAHASASATTVEAGAIVKLTLRIEGEGDFDTPRLTLDGFHVYGSIDKGHTIVYDVAPLDGGVTEIPAITFVYFEPGAGYREARTNPIALTVTGDAPAPAKTTFPWLPVGAVAVFALVAGTLLRRRRIEPDAAAVFRARAQADVTAAITEYLAARLGCPVASVIAPDLATRLRKGGVAGELAARTATFVEGLVAARYGGEVSASAPDEAKDLVRALEDADLR